MEEVDLLVVGAGTAGAAAAGAAAKRGLRVLCVDRAKLDAAGAHWINGVTREAFDLAGVPRPEGAELHADDGPFHMVAGWGPTRIVMRDHGVLEVDMGHLVARLQRRAREAGARLEGEVDVRGVEGDRATTSLGMVRAACIVDASGMNGMRLLGQASTRRRDICAAAQAVHRIRDRAGARAFLDRHETKEGETLCFSGVAGGYSILNVRVHGDEVALLTGAIVAEGHPSGRALIERFCEEQRWIGQRLNIGSRAIPLGRPHDVLAEGRVALLGDAARQVFSAHGSGIGPGMIAARLLADTLADGGSPADYGVAWMRRYGGLFAAYDVFRRFSQRLTGRELEQLIDSGLLDAEMVAAGLGQRFPRLTPRRALSMAPRLKDVGRLTPRLARLGARMAAMEALYRRYPRDTDARRRWRAGVRRLAGER